MSNFELLLDIIEIRQRVGSYYIASIKTKDLLEISSVDRMRMEKEGDCRASYLGIQRRLDESRVKKIAEYVKNSQGICRCDCGGIIKPDVVLYEESLDSQVLEKSIYAIAQCDLLIVGGTSLTVYPAAGLLRYYPGHRLVLINRDETPYDNQADLVLHESLGKVFEQLP